MSEVSTNDSNYSIKPDKNDGPQTESEVTFTKFTREPILEKGVDLLPGINKRNANVLRRKGYSKIYCLLGLYLCCDEQTFNEWLTNTAETDEEQTHLIYNSFKQWCQLHL